MARIIGRVIDRPTTFNNCAFFAIIEDVDRKRIIMVKGGELMELAQTLKRGSRCIIDGTPGGDWCNAWVKAQRITVC